VTLKIKFILIPKTTIWIILIGLWQISHGLTGSLFAGNVSDLKQLIESNDAITVANPQGQIIFSKNGDKKLIPASTLKIFTALVALHYLGPDHRFFTEFYRDKNQNLKIKGYGDPLLISEVLTQIAKSLSAKINRVNDIILDDSYFTQPLTIPGISSSSEPYDAPNGALCVNFNTVHFKKLNGTYISAEPQTPLLPFALKKIKTSKLNQGRIVLSHNNNECILYAGHLFQFFLEKEGIQINGGIKLGRIKKENDTLVLTYVSQFTLSEIIAKLLEHSNNYTTNQILIAAGTQADRPPGTLDKGIQAATLYAKKNLHLKNFKIAEGSGISRENKMSANDLDRVLQAFAPHRHLMRHEGREFYKTGTLLGISTRAGYIENEEGALYRYVILINTPGKSANRVMRKLLSVLN
jgi:D-alanyl-D-alanine carboxypeptidase/D-alanyl-D-alanine-endopeptidase (penicillin-binding protein 4)